LVVRGTGELAVRSLGGAALDGDLDGTAGGDYQTRINRGSLVLAAPDQMFSHAAAARLMRQSVAPRGPRQVRGARSAR
jgi:hypothetical protein